MSKKKDCAAFARLALRPLCGLTAWLWLGMLVVPTQSQEPLPQVSTQLPQRFAPESMGTQLTAPSKAVTAPHMQTAAGSEFLKLRPQFLSPTELSDALQLAIGNQGNLAVLDSQGLVLVAGPPEVLQRSVHMLEQIDTPRLQVRLAVYLFDVELQELKQLGLAAAKQLNTPAESANNDSSKFHVLASHLDLNQALKLLSESSGARLLADPQLIAIDRQTASFNTLMRIPLAQTMPSDRSGTSSLVGFEDVGVKLAVTPRIASPSVVELHLAPQYSSVVGFNNQSQPVIETRGADTTVRVAHRQTLVIGGLRRRNNFESAQTTTGLVNRKVVEPLFRTANAESTESELICIVRPEILGLTTAIAQDPVLQSASNAPALTGLLTAAPAGPENATAIQSGAYQEPLASSANEQVKPSAYRPSVYVKPNAAPRAPGKNINTSRNSVTQPLLLPSKQRK